MLYKLAIHLKNGALRVQPEREEGGSRFTDDGPA
jgi:hypothetical protein